MKKIYKPILFTFSILLLGLGILKAQTTVTIGTSQAVSTAQTSAYPTYFTDTRSQFLVTAAELNALGIVGAQNITAIQFNVSSLGGGGASGCPNGAVTNGAVKNYSLGMKNTSESMPINTAYDLQNITNVYSNSYYTPSLGWNLHPLSSTFQWDGLSNLLIDLCVANDGSTCNVCYTTNDGTYYTATTANSIRAYWTDGAGSWCGLTSFPNSCGTTPSPTASTARPDMKLTFVPVAPPVPPNPNFQFTLGADTFWVGASSMLINTSVNSAKNYWNVTQYSSVSSTGPWTAYSTLPKDTLQCNLWGCFIDTSRNDPNFTYSYPNRGFYKVQLTTVNNYGSSFIDKVIYVDTPKSKPTSLFFATRRQLGTNDRVQLNNLSSNAPVRNKWWVVNNCTSCPADSNKFLPSDSALNPVFAAYTPGTYKVCLAVTNSKGTDTFCRPDYMKVLPGYLMCHGETGRFDSVSRDNEGYLYSDLRTAAGVNLSGQFVPSNCNPIGFRIAPCADTIVVTLERLRVRPPTVGQGDSIYLRLNGYGGTIVRRWGGNNINAVKDSLKVYKFAGQYLYVTYSLASVSGGQPAMVNDSGFTLRWTSSAASYPKPIAGFTCPDTLYSGYNVRFMNSSQGKSLSYAWDLNNDGAFGADKPGVGIDSITTNPTYTFTTSVNTTRKICLKTMNCQGNDTFCRTVPLLPIISPPIANFSVNRTTGFLSDTFQFLDKSINGTLTWKWRFEPNNVTYLSGTDSTSQNPMISLNAAQYYNVTMIASNALGSSQITKNEIVNAIDYGSPNSAFPPGQDGTDFGITRVVIRGADKTLDTITPLKSPTYTRIFSTLQTTVYRGGTYSMDIYRNSAIDPENLRVWADYNRDADYLDENETILEDDQTTLVKTTKVFTVPENASIGISRILVGASSGISYISPISALIGVYEDYGMMIGNDVIKPIIIMNGGSNMATEINKSFTDPGATATDNIEGNNISTKIQTISNLNTSQLGFYTIKYYVVDLYGNVSDTLVRNVQVVMNQTGPSLDLLGPDSMTINVYSGYTEPGYIAKDNLNNIITGMVQRAGAVDTSKVGTYILTYTITDAFGLSASKTRVVMVKDLVAPVVLSYSGLDTVIHQIGTAFDDLKYVTATDNYWSDLIPVRISGTINANKVGSYVLTYKATDGSGNSSADKAITVNVTNKIKPNIELVGADVVNVPVYGLYNDLGAIATDYKGSLLAVFSDLNEKLRLDTAIWDCTVTYWATDEFGLTDSVHRRIMVKDMESPVIELLGDNPFVHPLHKDYIDPGVKVTDNFDAMVLTNVSKKDNMGLQVSIDSSKLNVHGAGLYYTVYVNATDANGNKAEERKRVVFVSMTGIEETVKADGYAIYPNPASTVFHIRLKSSELSKVTAFDMQGKAIELAPVKEGDNYRLDVGNLSTGLYLIRMECANGNTFNSKLTIGK